MITARRLEMIAGSVIAFAIVAVGIWSRIAPHQPIDNLQTLDGCYEGEGMPDFIRPPRHWSLRISNGSMLDRDGHTISKIQLTGMGDHEKSIAFSPGILVGGKPATLMVGDTVTGSAYVSSGRVTLVLADEQQEVLLKTTCS